MKPSAMMGFEPEGDKQVPVSVRDWNAMKLALWRNKVGWEIALREANAIVGRCAHVEGCGGAGIDSEPCLAGCPDREQRMSALVILNAARMFAPIDARRPANDPYSSPSREYFSEILSTLGAAQAELEALYEVLRTAGMQVPGAASNAESLPTEPAPPLLREAP